MNKYRVYWTEYGPGIGGGGIKKSKTVEADWAHVDNPPNAGVTLTFHRNVDGDPSDLVASFREWNYFVEVGK